MRLAIAEKLERENGIDADPQTEVTVTSARPQLEVTSPAEKTSGLVLDVDHEGALVIRLEDGTIRRVFVGDVSLRA